MLVTMRKSGLTLALFAFASTGLVAITHSLTEQTIVEKEREQLKLTLNQVIPESLHDNELYASCTLLQSDLLGSNEPLPAYIATVQGQPTAIAIESIAPDGYNGSILLLTGININGEVTGSQVLQHSETPGLGDKIDSRVSDWMTSFTGRTVSEENSRNWAVRKDGGQFDQFTGATITPRAVVKAVKNTLVYYNQQRDTIFSQALNPSSATSCGEHNE